MKYNDKELSRLSEDRCDLEGRLNYSRPCSNKYNQTGCKERWFKLKANLLFYFRINDTGKIDSKQPHGVLVLENCRIEMEVQASTPFALSIIFEDDWDRRHILSGRSEDHVSEWMNALRVASYEHWRSQLLILQKRISIHTGKDPLIMIPRNDGCRRTLQWSPQPTVSKFQSHLLPSPQNTSGNSVNDNASNNNWANFEDNQDSLIEFSPTKNGNSNNIQTKQKQSLPNQTFDNSWEFFESLNFGNEQRKTLNDSSETQNKRRGVMLNNELIEKENVDRCQKSEDTRFNPFDSTKNNSESQNNFLKPIPNPPSRSRSPKHLRTQVLAHSVHRTLSDSRLNQHPMPMPPVRKRIPKNEQKDKSNTSKFYITDDEDSDCGVTINPIYQSTSDIVDVCDLTNNKKKEKTKNTEVNLIDL